MTIPPTSPHADADPSVSVARPFFVTGGTLAPNAASYVERRADRDLENTLSLGQWAFVLNSRQMGKSSLCIRTRERLQDRNIATVFLDLSRFGGGTVTPEQWYAALAAETGRALQVRAAFLARFKERAELPLVERYFVALEETVRESSRDGRSPIVLFVDEVDAVLSLPFAADEFFSAARALHNRGASQPDANGSAITFCFVGSALPQDLIRDPRASPFNIGQRIELCDFTLEESVAALAPGLESGGANATGTGRFLVERIHYWTGGHPYLTQLLCGEAAVSSARSPGDVDALVLRLFLDARARTQNSNLVDVANRLLRGSDGGGREETNLASPASRLQDEQRAAVLTLYARALQRDGVADDESSPTTGRLRISGIVRSDGGRLRVRNRIYQMVFDRIWVEENLPGAEKRRQRQAYQQGVQRTSLFAGIAVLLLIYLMFTALRNASDARATNAQLEEKNAELGRLLRKNDSAQDAVRQMEYRLRALEEENRRLRHRRPPLP